MEKRERAEFSRKLAPRCAGDLQGRKGEQDEKAEYAPRQESVFTVFGLISLGDRSVSATPAVGGAEYGEARCGSGRVFSPRFPLCVLCDLCARPLFAIKNLNVSLTPMRATRNEIVPVPRKAG